MPAREFVLAMAWLGLLLLIALLFPNTLQLMARYEPALDVRSKPAGPLSALRALDWSPTAPWAVAMSAFVVAAVMRLGGKSEFLYWQF
jgi:alginate O-acetyltransferase complex protein AlgI